jgi:hypothetical protein
MSLTPICDAVEHDLGLVIEPLLAPHQPWSFNDADHRAVEAIMARDGTEESSTHKQAPDSPQEAAQPYDDVMDKPAAAQQGLQREW